MRLPIPAAVLVGYSYSVVWPGVASIDTLNRGKLGFTLDTSMRAALVAGIKLHRLDTLIQFAGRIIFDILLVYTDPRSCLHVSWLHTVAAPINRDSLL